MEKKNKKTIERRARRAKRREEEGRGRTKSDQTHLEPTSWRCNRPKDRNWMRFFFFFFFFSFRLTNRTAAKGLSLPESCARPAAKSKDRSAEGGVRTQIGHSPLEHRTAANSRLPTKEAEDYLGTNELSNYPEYCPRRMPNSSCPLSKALGMGAAHTEVREFRSFIQTLNSRFHRRNLQPAPPPGRIALPLPSHPPVAGPPPCPVCPPPSRRSGHTTPAVPL